MKYKCPHCEKETISYKQKFLVGYLSKNFGHCKECDNRFKYSIGTLVFTGIFALVYEVCLFYMLYKLDNDNLWYVVSLILFIPFVVHFGKLVKIPKSLTMEIEPTLLKEKTYDIDKDIEHFKTKQ
ncbi:hypothetical protein RJI07_05975 [Mycoplasmatota bacterium WC30]